MTFPEFVAVLARRWYMPVVALLCALVVTWSFTLTGARYATRTEVVFSLPWTSGFDRASVNDPNVIAFAGAIATEVNGGKPPLWYASSDAPYYGAGLRRAILLGVPNAGGQWSSSFSTAVIEINIVGPSREWVEAEQQALVRKIERAAQERQAKAGFTEQRMTATVDPWSTEIVVIAPTRSSRLAAVLAMMAAALMVGGWGAIILDRALNRQRRPRRALGSSRA